MAENAYFPAHFLRRKWVRGDEIVSGKTLTLIAILAFVIFVVGTFVWFIGKWNASEDEALTGAVPAKTEERQA
ncbi:hypothetical protein [Roseovarius sp. THAF8]|uniref:hypothetical protein n=1 Tax=Roseovarius sp. THAF8 TaxID=2587846 RepID=UPI00156212FF|nr:hypothetical protein [Roseovarius sp. THAF8]